MVGGWLKLVFASILLVDLKQSDYDINSACTKSLRLVSATMNAVLSLTNSLITTTLKLALIALIFILVSPLAYFAWRAGQPMDAPQFGGLSYYQFLKERHQDYIKLAQQYQAGHPLDESQEEAAEKIEELVTPIAVKLQ